MRFLSLFSGIEAASVAWHPLGWECVGVAEIEGFPCTALKHHYPHVPNLGDVTKATAADIARLGRIDLIVFGSPCQDLSVAGKRKGLDGARSGLFFTAMQIVEWCRQHCGLRFALWENVPGAFTSNDGRDFAAVVEHLAGLADAPVPPKGWGNEGCAVGEEAMVEWATLDAQWFGVAQRRRRVFALADFGDWASRPPVLLEPQGLRGDSSPSRGAGQDVAGTLASCAGGGGFPSTDNALDGYVVPDGGPDGPICVSNAEGSTGLPFLTVSNLSKTVNNQTPLIAYMPARTLAADGGVDERFAERDICDALHTSSGSGNKAPIIAPAIAYSTKLHNTSSNQSGKLYEEYTVGLDANSPPPALLTPMAVRRLTPRECERLQAFPDDYTAVPQRGKTAADGPRYKALGNSMCVNVMAWIGRRLDFVHHFYSEPAAALDDEQDLFA